MSIKVAYIEWGWYVCIAAVLSGFGTAVRIHQIGVVAYLGL